MTAAFGADAPHIFGLLGSPLPSWQALRVAFGAWRTRGTAWVAETVRLLLASPREWLDENFENEKLKTMLAMWGMHLDFSPDCAGGALFPYLESMADQAFGMALGRGGADIDRHRHGARHNRGRRRSAARRAGAKHRDRRRRRQRRRARRRRADRRHRARSSPICIRACLFGKLVPASSAAAQRLAKFRPGPATMMIHLALNDLPAWSAGAELRRFAYVHLAPSLAAMAKTYTDALDGLLPAEPGLVVGQPTAIDPSRAPAGKHVLWVQVRVLPSRIRGDAAGTIAGRDWDEIKEAYADRVIGIIERYAPGFSANIIARTVLSPADLERDNPNLVGGDSLGGSHHLDQNFLFRPAFGWSRYRTPVDRLYMVGASTWPGAGTGAGSGFMLGKMLAGA